MALLKRLKRGVFRQPLYENEAKSLYQACVAQARQPIFYETYQVEDSIDGRFDMVCLHVCLILNRLDLTKTKEACLAQDLFDAMFKDFEQNLRLMGISDLKISKEMKKMWTAFNGRRQMYLTALKNSREALAATLHKNLYKDSAATKPQNIEKMAKYTLNIEKYLAKTGIDDIFEGKVQFNAPENYFD